MNENVNSGAGNPGGDTEKPVLKLSMEAFLAKHKPAKAAARIVMHMDEIKALRHHGYSLEQIKDLMLQVHGIKVSVGNLQQILFRSAEPLPPLPKAEGELVDGKIKKASRPRRTRKSFDLADIEKELAEIEKWREIKSRSSALLNEILSGEDFSGAVKSTRPQSPVPQSMNPSNSRARVTGADSRPRHDITASGADGGENATRQESTGAGIAKAGNAGVRTSDPTKPWTGNPVRDAQIEAEDELRDFKLGQINSGGVFAKHQKTSQEEK
jgi:hypothetical protein